VSRELAQLKGVRLSLGGAPLFEGVDLALIRGERAALVGDNGAGKSTLMRILARGLDPDAGERTIANGASLAYVAQEPDLAGYATLRDYVVAPFVDAAETPAYVADAALVSWGLDGARAPEGLSGGETRRAALARAFAADVDILLLDEPTNHLDIPAIEDLEARLRAFSGAVLIVSHDRRFLERASTACHWLRNGRVQRLDRGFGAFDEWAAGIEASEQKALARLETHLAAEEHWLRRGVTARRSRNEGRRRKLEAMRAERRRQTSLLSGSSAALEAGKGGDSGRLVIEAKGLAKSYGGRPIVKDLSLRIVRGDRVGVIGPNGAGKTTLVDLLLGRLAPDAGTVRLGANLEIAYVDQMRAGLDPAATIHEVLCPLGGDQVMVRGKPRHVAAYARDFLFQPGQLRQPTAALSGGERNRLALAAALAKTANLIVLDEPTNDLDMDTLDALEDMLSGYDGTVLIVSHDRAFLDGVTTQVVGALGGGRWVESPGGYEDFVREHGGFGAPPATPKRREAAPAPQAPSARAPRKLSFKDERALAEIEARLPALEAEISALEARLADPAFFTADPRGYAAAAARLDAARAEKDRDEHAWLEIEEKRAALEA
jgi:ABC transport system ATP-binding/permease protein